MTPWWAGAVLLWAAARAAGDWLDCRPLCRCKWSSGKKSAGCASAGLTEPPALSPDIQVLDLHGNNLSQLPKDAFASVGLLNLQRLNLRESGVRSINREAFRYLKILVELDLADNLITEIPADTFRGNERLRFLVLSGNPIKTLVSDQFPPLPHLRNIEMVNCKLRSIHPAAFRNLQVLESFDVQQNRLTRLSVHTFNLPPLKTLALGGNPWRCDCQLRAFRDWFLSTNLGTGELYCSEPPSAAGRSWHEVSGNEMSCAPELKSSTRVVRAEQGADVSFGCLVRGDPKPEITWTFNATPLDNASTTFEFVVDETEVPDKDDSEIDDSVWSIARWSNISIANITTGAAGEWICISNSSAGTVRASISVLLPRAETATARAEPGLPALLGALGGALGALAALGLAIACVCWRTRSRRVPPSRSFTDQEKKLLDASLAASCDRSSTGPGSPSGIELTERSPSPVAFEPVHITIEGCEPAFPPPPPEFALPRGYGNIFISVQVAGGPPDRYPDLLGGGATLPRRARACCAAAVTASAAIARPGPAYDNMGPRVTAGGSSTWSLPGVDPPVPLSIASPAPPPEFVSL